MADGFASSGRTDVVDAVREVLRCSAEPMTIPKIRERLPAPHRRMRLEELADVVQRQVAANVLVACPKYRSSQDRYWDRSLREHAKVVLHESLRAGPMAWADLRKKFPKYLRHLAESVLNEELARAAIFRQPETSPRMGPRYALDPPDVRTYAARELRALVARLEQYGFDRMESCEAIVQLVQENEWGTCAATDPAKSAAAVHADWLEKTMS